MKKEKILILDFGGQYSQLIARRVREESVYSEILPCYTPIEKIKQGQYKGIILTGGPNSVYAPTSTTCDPEIFNLNIPILGICYGAQFMAHTLNGKVKAAEVNEFGETPVDVNNDSVLFENVDSTTSCWMSHKDHIVNLPDGFVNTASSKNCPIAAMEYPQKSFYAVQFHPEVNHTHQGQTMLKNFIYSVCKCTGDWTMSSFAQDTIQNLKDKLQDSKVLCAFSGGVDSAVAGVLTHKAIGHNLICIFIDHGLLRKDEGDQVEKVFAENFNMNLKRVNVQKRFYKALKGVTDPEEKRKIIGKEFIRVFEEEAKKIGKIDYLVQGTIYPDVVESGIGEAAVIKSHHNVGGLPKNIEFKELVEPLRNLFKDEVRKVGIEIGIPEHLVWRQPFPGPGLAVRIIGKITPKKIKIVQDADAIFRDEIAKAGLNMDINQYFAVLTNMRSVGVMGDSRTYDYTLALRAVTTSDFMTADWAKIPYDVLQIVSNRIVNEVEHVNRIVYDITSKPPATIEWE